MDRWLAQPEVLRALHVSKQGSQSYRRTAADLRPLYKTLAQKYRILICKEGILTCLALASRHLNPSLLQQTPGALMPAFLVSHCLCGRACLELAHILFLRLG